MKPLLFLLFLCASASAGLRTIVVDGQFWRQKNPGYFGLALPIAFEFTVTYDDEAEDEDPSPLLGVYETEGACTTLRFGDALMGGFNFYFSAPNTEVRVWNGFGGLYGVSFGNEDAFTQFGLSIPPYFLYGIFCVPAGYSPFPSDDDLRWVALLADSEVHRVNSYVFLSGVSALGVVTELQTGGTELSYGVPVVTPRPR